MQIAWIAASAFCLAGEPCLAETRSGARLADWQLKEGRLLVDGRPVFLKTAKPLRDFSNPEACRRLAGELDILRSKGFNAISLNCYWHHFDHDGDGSIDVSLTPLSALIDAIHGKQMFPCLSVETYGVGGGQIPEGFWKRYPEALARNADGKEVRDTEYGFHTAVPSIFHPAYRKAVRTFIGQLVRGVPSGRILYYETTVEPQFMGVEDIDYSSSARKAYETWREKAGLDRPMWPADFPIPEAFRHEVAWLHFRAESLADWVNHDAAAFREAAGKDAYIAVDYLETCGREMPLRNGDSVRFLEALTCADIIQVNWHWRNDTQRPNDCAYRKVRDVMRRKNRPWAITEHMTLNG